jgi:hypothetical protein
MDKISVAIVGLGRIGSLLEEDPRREKPCTHAGAIAANRLLDVLWHDGTHQADAIMFLAGGVLKHRRNFGDSLARKEGTAWIEGRLAKPCFPDAVELEDSVFSAFAAREGKILVQDS